MGKKKPQKIKELSSIEIAEAASSSKEAIIEQQEEQQKQVPRKRGRPKKIIVKMEEKKAQASMDIIISSSSMEQEQGKENKEEEAQVPKGGMVVASRSRVRRKSKPTKSMRENENDSPYKSYVRGVEVDLSHSSIMRTLQIRPRSFPKASYEERTNGDPRYEDIVSDFCVLGMNWIRDSHGGPNQLRRGDFIPEAKGCVVFFEKI
ncbi:uncharacterized protein LOC107631960 [Arachis ipaensis]|uniref:uncharacterized protein LOC107631960 n=1 Tax=Arachis ipaensis TaxID=130454 RepID=UPI000A2B07E1|nr:uncharacterized protein LOC107631960 [Arachis ipaensis]XP_020975697.1 uncharacterized protein LOC107631960 [Arachis ipaensis]XP_020975698.1 uncharacterized protein LOC107631960 [Arachis ipaensis]XP_020975699.1 uncharacterized protein LOC107631960 [Arachis ipaensis]